MRSTLLMLSCQAPQRRQGCLKLDPIHRRTEQAWGPAGFHMQGDLIRWSQRYADAPQVEQIGEAKVLWKRREFTTLLKVDEDERDPNNLITAFSLIRSVSSLHTVREIFLKLHSALYAYTL